MNIELIPIRGSGNLCFLEAERDFPFPLKRVYYIHGEKVGTHRGFHSHKTLNQILLCPYGNIKILLDDGKERREILLNDPTKGLLIPENIWHEMIWLQDDSVLCVLASDYYYESDYIRNYDQFLTYVRDLNNAN